MKRYLLSIVLVIMLTLVTACGQNNSSAAPAQNGEAEKKEEAVQTGDTTQAAEAAQAAETMQGAEAAPAVDTAQAAEAAQADENGQTAKAAQADDTAQAAETALAGDTAKAAETALTAEEQRRILEDNRSLWTFDQEDYSPDWYYAFTDLDHNGLLEVLAASTQGSGMFTYAHFYEVLPDGSGIKNLYHADEEVEGPDDWLLLRLHKYHPGRRGAQHLPDRCSLAQGRRGGVGVSRLHGHPDDRFRRGENLL